MFYPGTPHAASCDWKWVIYSGDRNKKNNNEPTLVTDANRYLTIIIVVNIFIVLSCYILWCIVTY